MYFVKHELFTLQPVATISTIKVEVLGFSFGMHLIMEPFPLDIFAPGCKSQS